MRPRTASDRWLVSYADFITLLFAFFATMYAVSSVDARKLAGVAQALNRAPAGSVREAPSAAAGGPVAAASDALARDLRAELDTGQLELGADRRGLVLSIPEAGLFPPGSDELSGEARALVGRVALALAGLPNPLRVEGHTDDRPIHTPRFRSNWELSTARATRVIEVLLERGVAPERLSAAGYAEFHPRVDNGSPEGRARNRRVDLIILNEGSTQAEAPAGRPR